MKAFIKGISYYLPEKILTNADLVSEFPEWSVQKVTEKIGINQRHISSSSETASDMAIQSAKNLFEEYNIDKTCIDFVLFCTQSPDYFLPASSCLIQERLGLETSVGAIDYNQGCSGYIYGLSLAKGLLYAGISKNVLLLTAETYSKHIHPRDKGNRSIFGDASAATLISSDGFAEILDFSLGTDGLGAKNLIVETGAMRCMNSKNSINWDENGNPLSEDHLYMNGSEIFNFTLEEVPKMIKEVLARNGFRDEEIDLFILHQANKFMLEFLRKKLRIPSEKFYYFLENVGNTVSSTIPIAIKEAMKDKTIVADTKVLLGGFGVGYSWGGTVIRY
jgi:3-oxoacyl-[acyl-carrier-protein] synthase-3